MRIRNRVHIIVASVVTGSVALAAQAVSDRDFRALVENPITREEVEATFEWVRGGGRLLLIANHMPLAGAAASLAAAFGVTFTDGFAVERSAFTTMRLESGRAAFSGEAAMFSARFQLVGAERRAMGMNAAGAEQNFQFVLNVMHWLSELL